jgi:hypothetical protein
MNTKKNEDLIKKADDALHDRRVNILNNGEIKDSYNGQTAALGITIAMSGLRPALAIYRKQSTEECDKCQILNAIAIMNEDIVPKDDQTPGKTLFHKVVECNDNELKDFKKKIIDSSIALKQVIRTYKLVK